MSIEEIDEIKTSVDKLFELVSGRGDERLPLLDPATITDAARLFLRDPKTYTQLLGKLAGWHSFSTFKSAVRKRVADAAAKRKKREAQEAAEKRLEEAEEMGKPFIAMGNPIQVAEDFKAQCMPHLRYTGGEWLDYEVNCYLAREDREVRSRIQAWMASGVDAESGEPCHPDKFNIDKVVDALANNVFRPLSEAEPPTWFDYLEDIDPDPKTIIAAKNGLLDVKNNYLYPNDPKFFTRNGLTYNYDPNAPAPKLWLKFLEDLWPDDEGGAETKAALQEIIGHLLTGETKYQKIFIFVGASGSGKGTIARVLEALIGSRNLVSQSVTKLGKEFGLKALIGKQVLIVPDLRLGKDSNIGGIAEVLLNISGEDNLSIGRKYMDDKQVRLQTRIVLMSNMGLILPDQSGAFARRLVPLVFTKRFTGREDVNLSDKLCQELPSILNWALDGLRRLEARVDKDGHRKGFVLTTKGKVLLDGIHRQGSSVQAFLDECCTVATGKSIAKKDLYAAFEGWCLENELTSTYRRETFSGVLVTASGNRIGTERPNKKGKREWCYSCVALKPEFVGLWSADEEGDF